MKPYYKTEKGKLFCCDNVKYINTVKDNNFDLTVTSPPYDNLRDYKGYSWNFEALAKELYRTTKDGGVVVWVVGDATINGSETGSSFRQALYFMECGFNLHDTMIYEKNGMSNPDINRYYSIFEYMFIFSKEKPQTFNPIKDRKNKWKGGWGKKTHYNKAGKLIIKEKMISKNYSMRDNIWRYNTGKGFSSEENIEHPAIFPEKLAYDHIVSWSNENELVFDPFMGSGTTAKMCEKSNRKWIGCEISKEYCKIAKQRVENEREQLKFSFA